MGHANTPPQLPQVTDEAGDTPRWVPLLGIALLLLGLSWIAADHSHLFGENAEPSEASPAEEPEK